MLRASLLWLVGAMIVGAAFMSQQKANAEHWLDNDWHGQGWQGNRGWYGYNHGWLGPQRSWYGWNIDRGQRILLHRLNHGRTTGRLTLREYRSLYHKYDRSGLDAPLNTWERQAAGIRMDNRQRAIQRSRRGNPYAERYRHRW